MDFRSDRVLITGASGFTGRVLASRLRNEGASVFGLGRVATGPDEIAGDLNDPASLRRAVQAARPTAVVHLAGVTHAAHGDVAEIYQSNVTGTAALLSAVRDHAQPRVVILASSATVYAAPIDDAPLSEDAPLVPQNHYGASKMAMEQVARLFAPTLPIVVTRPFNYTGAGQSPSFLVSKIVDHFVRGERSIELGNLDLYRDFSDVRTVVEAYLALLATAPVGEVLNLCSGRAVHLSTILDHLAAIAGYRIDVTINPAFVRAGEPRTIVGSTSRMDQAIGALRPPPFVDTLRWMYEAGKAGGEGA